MNATERYLGAEISRLRHAVSRGTRGLSDYERQGPRIRHLFHEGYGLADHWLRDRKCPIKDGKIDEARVWEESHAQIEGYAQADFVFVKEEYWRRGWEARVFDYLSMRKYI
jgi:hypothetical protein